MKQVLAFIMCLAATLLHAQELYVKTFGSKKDTPVVFLHGGPGYNCAAFEATTAQALADKGFYVIAYDRRGEGRSPDPNAKYDFDQTFADLDAIYRKHNITKAALIGHSFGGIVGTLYTEKYPARVDALVLVGAPVSLQESFGNIIEKSRFIYETKGDKTNLNYLALMGVMDKTTMEYASFCFAHAMQNGFYSPKNKSESAKAIQDGFRKSPEYAFASQMTIEPPKGFSVNERYTTLDLSENLKKLVASKKEVYGLYGKEDGLYSAAQVEKLGAIIGKPNLLYLDDCSHNVFIDQQPAFLDALTGWLK